MLLILSAYVEIVPLIVKLEETDANGITLDSSIDPA